MPKKQNRKSRASTKTTQRFSFKPTRFHAFIFIIGFALFGALVLGRNFAAENTILSLQGEAMTGSGSVISDTTANKDKALKITTSVAAKATFTTTEIGSKLLLRARGTQCNGAPQADISIDGKQLLLKSVTNATGWVFYHSDPTIAAGNHTILVKMTNPVTSSACSRQLFIDTIYIEKKLSAQPRATNSPSGEEMPVGNIPGWQQIFSDDFVTDAAIGSFKAAYGTKWRTYSGPDTASKIYPNKQSEYNTAKVVSVNGGILDKYLHTEYDANGYNGGGNYMMSAALVPIGPGQLYGRYTVRLRADAVDGYKIAWLLWPDTGTNTTGAVGGGGNGEIDFAEANLTSPLKAFIHRQGATVGNDQTSCKTDPGVYLSSGWHTVTLEWAPTTKIYVDGVLECQSSDRIPNTPMHLVLQTESSLISTASTSRGHLQLDWVSVYKKL